MIWNFAGMGVKYNILYTDRILHLDFNSLLLLSVYILLFFLFMLSFEKYILSITSIKKFFDSLFEKDFLIVAFFVIKLFLIIIIPYYIVDFINILVRLLLLEHNIYSEFYSILGYKIERIYTDSEKLEIAHSFITEQVNLLNSQIGDKVKIVLTDTDKANILKLDNINDIHSYCQTICNNYLDRTKESYVSITNSMNKSVKNIIFISIFLALC